jgi:sugar lactone lactonase YvrE
VANSGNGTIKKFDSDGNGSTFASGIYQPGGLAFDSSGYLYASNDTGTIDKFDSSGNKSTFASGLNYPVSLAFDSSGNLYATNWVSETIMKFDSSGNGSIFASNVLFPWGIAIIPEPASVILFTFGGLALLGRKRK